MPKQEPAITLPQVREVLIKHFPQWSDMLEKVTEDKNLHVACYARLRHKGKALAEVFRFWTCLEKVHAVTLGAEELDDPEQHITLSFFVRQVGAALRAKAQAEALRTLEVELADCLAQSMARRPRLVKSRVA